MNESTGFTSEQLADWKRYEHARKDGTWNMFDPHARAATGLSRDRYLFVMRNYVGLREIALKEPS